MIDVDGKSVPLGSEDVTIVRSFAEGWAGAADGNTVVLLDKRITPQPKNEGLARDIVRNVQNLRKEAGLDIADRITLSLVTESEELREAIDQCRDYVAGETLAIDIASNALDGESARSVVKIHGQPVTITLMKAS